MLQTPVSRGVCSNAPPRGNVRAPPLGKRQWCSLRLWEGLRNIVVQFPSSRCVKMQTDLRPGYRCTRCLTSAVHFLRLVGLFLLADERLLPGMLSRRCRGGGDAYTHTHSAWCGCADAKYPPAQASSAPAAREENARAEAGEGHEVHEGSVCAWCQSAPMIGRCIVLAQK